MTNPLSPAIHLTLDYYQSSINLTLLHLQKISTHMHNLGIRNISLMRNQTNIKIPINQELNLFEIFSEQLNEIRSQSESDISDWIKEFSTIRKENTDFIKNYALVSSKLIAELSTVHNLNRNLNNKEESNIPSFLQQKMNGQQSKNSQTKD
jgi:hypothetical protein